MTNTQMYEVLKRYWGFDSFLPLQQESILSILKRNDSLTVLATGGGKSLCFQLPALIMDGLAVVISPLISLMKDQVDDLLDMGVASCFLNSSLSVDAQTRAVEDIKHGRIKLLYISPERFQDENTINLLNSIKLAFFVIDEAHCISHWGHDFRKNYRGLWMIKERFSSVSVHAFTATATKKVQQDIIEQLRFSRPNVHIGDVDRPNLTYRVLPRKKILGQIVDTLAKHANEAGIIYCLRRKDVDYISTELTELGIANVRYHAGMSDEDRHAAQEKFSREDVNLVVATIAFGMGIDRSNIRFIVHAGMPKSVEHYQQETGRAGRDGLDSFCYMFYGGGDYRLWSYFADNSSEREVMKKKLNTLYDFCARPQCRHKVLVTYFGQAYGDRACGACDYCLNELDLVEDALLLGQKILSCVAKVRQGRYGFGAGHITNVLKGTLNEKIEKLAHNKLSTFGLLKEEPEVFIRYMIEQLLGQDFLAKENEFSTLSITDKGKELLRGNAAPVLTKPLVAKKKKEITIASEKMRAAEWEHIDHGLFQKLREKRSELAMRKGVPAYIIFSDKTLRDLASRKPLDKDDFASVYGVGARKLRSYADTFIKVITDHAV